MRLRYRKPLMRQAQLIDFQGYSGHGIVEPAKNTFPVDWATLNSLSGFFID